MVFNSLEESISCIFCSGYKRGNIIVYPTENTETINQNENILTGILPVTTGQTFQLSWKMIFEDMVLQPHFYILPEK